MMKTRFMLFCKVSNIDTIFFVFLFSLLLITSAHSQQRQTPTTRKDNLLKTDIVLSDEEKAFLQNRPVIRLGTDHRWEPYVIKKADDSLEGFDIDLLRIINDMTGADIEIVTGRWSEIVEQAKNREIDGLADSVANKEREPFFNFTIPYFHVFPVFVVKHDSALNIQSIDSLSGQSVAILKGHQFYLSLLKNYPTIKVIEASSEVDALKLTIEGKTEASIVATTSYNTHYKVFSNLIKIGYVATDKPLHIVYSVRKDWPELKSILDKGISAIPRETYDKLFYKWFNMEPVRHVQRDREIKTVIVDNYFPYSFVNDKGEPDGFSVDLIKAVAKELGMHIEIRVEVWDNALKKLSNDKINVLPMMAYSEKRDKKFDFSPPHTVAYDAYFTRKDSPKIENPNDLQGKKIIVMKNDRAHDYLKSIPFINEEQLIYENSTAEAMRNLASGIGDTAVMPKVLGLVLVNKLKIEKVDTSPEVVQNYQRAFSFAVKEGNSGFLARLENGLQIIKEMGEYKKIHEKWLGVYETHEVSFGYEGKVAESRGEGVADIPPGRRETILLVEDDLQILKLARQILDALGYTVLTAGTPDEAIDLAKKHTGEIHLLITDVIMPEMNGRELSEQIQPLYPNLKRMFMSGYTANVIAHHGVLDEGMHFIQKPFSKSDLATTVRKVLDEAKS